MQPIISIKGVTKSYASGLQALQPVDLDIEKGEIFAPCSDQMAPARTTLTQYRLRHA